ncbi:MAG: efflux transporter outer membrane subunit [Alphaproteobacteria bacterium]
MSMMKKSMRSLILLSCSSALLFSLGGCTAGKDYEAPAINAPQQFVSQDVIAALNIGKSEAAAETLWWEGFDDTLLNSLIESGLERNFSIAAATARIREAEARVTLAGASFKPSVSAGGSSNLQERRALSQNRESTTTTSAGADLNIAIPLDISGRNRREIEAAMAGLEAARADLNGAILGISADIAAEYLTLRGNQRQLELLRESVALQEQTLSIVRSRYEAGLSPELDFRRAETSVENLRADIPALEQALQNSRNRIATLSGDFPGAREEELRSASAIPSYQLEIPDILPMDVLRARPDIQRAEAQFKQAIANIGVAEAAYYPDFRLSGTLGLSATGVSSLPVAHTLIASLAALITQVIADGGARDANLEIAEARAQEALANYEQTLREASEDVERSLAALNASQERQAALERSLNASRRSFSQAETLYQQGLISFLDVVDAQRSLANTEQQLARERTNTLVQIARLFESLGTQIR